MEAYKKLLKEYKDKVIDSYEDWLSKFTLFEIDENGGFCNSLIDEEFEFLFNLELTKSLQNIIINLLNDEYDEKSQKKKDEYIKLGVEFVKLKRITDKRILESKAYDKDWVNEWLFDIKEESIKTTQKEEKISPIHLNSKLVKPDDIITKLHSFLTEERFIKKCSLKDFKIHFEEKSQSKSKIIWFDENAKLVELILLLEHKKILKPNRRNKDRPFISIITQHFTNKQNKDFNKNSISTTISKKLSEDFSGFSKVLVEFFEKLKIEFN